MRRAQILLVLMLGLTPMAAQEAASADLDARLRALEARAARADLLEHRVHELEGRLATYEDADAEEQLAGQIHALLESRGAGLEVTAPHSTSLAIGGQIRTRGEYSSVTRYGVANPRGSRDLWVSQRTRLHVDARITEDIRGFVQIQDSRRWGFEAGAASGPLAAPATDTMNVDLHQGFVDFERLFGSDLTLRAGRTELSLWNQRLISPLDWSPVGRAWDGVHLMGDVADDLEVLVAWDRLADRPPVMHAGDLYIGALTYQGFEDQELGAGLIWVHDKNAALLASFGTATLHFQGRTDGFDYSADFAYQFGDLLGAHVAAYAWAATAGYTFDGDLSPRVGAGWTFGSGDSSPGSGDITTFNPLFPFGHSFQGYLDLFSWMNGSDIFVEVSVKPDADWWIGLAGHGFWVDEQADAWYGASTLPIRSGPFTKSHVGMEIDLTAKYWFTKKVWLWFGYAHFFPGDLVRTSGPAPSTDWFFIQLTADF
jgi:hypothetical protein